MSKELKTITIYGSSSSTIDSEYMAAAKRLGELLALHNIDCINGGGRFGVMAAVTEGVLSQGGKVTGIIPQFMIDNGWLNDSLTELIITADMHQRKQLMAQKADACIALPGGIGTLEELLEVMAWKQLELYRHPIVILNTNGFYDPLFAMLKKAESEHFMRHERKDLWTVAATPEEAIKRLIES
ncbi:MAG: TIGR00730 family Rossman fold protein [Dysgonamonadaceae bacterium]|nr:TIGR00730 family Rossman fold protein [Dysgonamonadaceae bacterium]